MSRRVGHVVLVQLGLLLSAATDEQAPVPPPPDPHECTVNASQALAELAAPHAPPGQRKGVRLAALHKIGGIGVKEWIRSRSALLEPHARKLSYDSGFTAWEASLRKHPDLAASFRWSPGRPLPVPPARERIALGLATEIEEPVSDLLQALVTDNACVDLRLKWSSTFAHAEIENFFLSVQDAVGRMPTDVVIRTAAPGASSYGWRTDVVRLALSARKDPANTYVHVPPMSQRCCDAKPAKARFAWPFSSFRRWTL